MHNDTINHKKLPRHLKMIHLEKPEILELMLETDSVTKRELLRKLSNMRHHKHNCEVLWEQRGSLIVVYRPTED